MGMPPPGKEQFNTYLPKHLVRYVEEVRENTGLPKNLFIQLVLAFFGNNFTFDEIKRLAGDLMIFGEEGLKLPVKGAA